MQALPALLLVATCFGAIHAQLSLPGFPSLPSFPSLDSFKSLLPDNLIFSYDPDQDRTTCQIVQARGFVCEIHLVTTYQGYIIQLHRVLPMNGSSTTGKKPVILQTGLIGTSADFIMATANVTKDASVIGRDMGIELAKQGYDVWLSNNRGNQYGLQHVSMSPSDPKFWNFTWQDISKYDTPAIVDFVLNATGSADLHFIGHSQGTAVMFALLSQTDAFNQKISSFTAISPITRIGDAKTAFKPFIAVIMPYLVTFGGPVFSRDLITTEFVPMSCDFLPSRMICEIVFFAICGFDYSQLEQKRMGVYMGHMPTSTSAKNLIAFHQMFKSNKFQKFDYGKAGNLREYGQAEVPVYPLTNITHPSVYVIYGENDWFVPLSGVEALETDLKNAKEFYSISSPKANHMDPLIGIDDAVEVNKKVLSILKANE